jgi:hypothetical protein
MERYANPVADRRLRGASGQSTRRSMGRAKQERPQAERRVPNLGRCFRLFHLRVLVVSRFEIAGPSFRLTSSGTDAGEPHQPKVA